MYNDPNYIALNNLSFQLESQIPKGADLQYLLNASGTITQSQFIYTVKELGFNDTTAFRAFQNKQIPLQQYLHAKYFTGEDTVLTISSNLQKLHNNMSPCSAQYNSCMHSAASDYTFHILDCTGLAIGFGAVSSGVGGILFQLGCGAYSIHVLNQAKSDCLEAYQNCNK